jgi:hypothetical protein
MSFIDARNYVICAEYTGKQTSHFSNWILCHVFFFLRRNSAICSFCITVPSFTDNQKKVTNGNYCEISGFHGGEYKSYLSSEMLSSVVL